MVTGPVTDAERAYLREALALAEHGWGRVHPNPLVGALVVSDGAVVGRGYHAEYGGAHAEVAALEAAGGRARDATLYVTLEPCCHHGKTPPCTEAIRAAGIRRVVYGASDSHEEAGGGAARLRAAGLEVTAGVEREAVRAQNAAYFHAVERATAYVALKYGLSLDARIAERDDRSTVVTGSAAHDEVHRLRAGFEAILVGARTARVDDPLLTARGAVRPRRPPIRLVADPDARLPVDSRLVRTADEVPVWVLCAEDAPRERRRTLDAAGARTITVARSDRGVAVDAALDALWREGVRSILCEGGGRLGAALLAADRVERLFLFYAPRLFGRRGVPAFPGEYPAAVGRGWRMQDVRRMDADVLLVLDRRR